MNIQIEAKIPPGVRGVGSFNLEAVFRLIHECRFKGPTGITQIDAVASGDLWIESNSSNLERLRKLDIEIEGD